MNSDLVALHTNLAVYGLIDETCAANRSNVDFGIPDVLYVHALDGKGKQDTAVCKVLNDYVFLSLVV